MSLLFVRDQVNLDFGRVIRDLQILGRGRERVRVLTVCF